MQIELPQARPPFQQRGGHPSAPRRWDRLPRVLALTWQGHRGCDLCRAGVRGRVTPVPSGRKARVLHPHRHAEQRGATAGSPRKGQRDRVQPGEWGWDSSPRAWPNPGSRTTSILGDPSLTRLLVKLEDGPEAPEVPSHLCSSGMRMGRWERGDGPIPNPESNSALPTTHRAGRRWVGQVGGQSPPAPPEVLFPPQRTCSPEREKEKAEGLGKKNPGSVDNINERLSHRDCF